jgi:spermidine synthase
MIVLAAAVVVAVATFTRLDQLTLSSGVYRNGRLLDDKHYSVIYYRDGRTASVSARRQKEVGHVSIATNGKPDASLRTMWLQPPAAERGTEVLIQDEPTQLLLALITLAHAPQGKTGAVIGQGSGMSSHFLLGSPHLTELQTIEIEPAMIAGSRRAFYPANKRVFDDPRAHFVVDDAKSYFASAHKKFDIIMSEPSNPWVSGVSGLFTSEFYERVSGYLTDDGVFGQWLHLYEINDKLVLSVLAALHERFRSYEIFLVSNTDILIVASNRPSVPKPDWSVFQYPDIERDLMRFQVITPAALEQMRLANRPSLAPLFELSRHPNSDFYPILDLGTERTRFLHSEADGFENLNNGRFDLVSAAQNRRVDFAFATATPVPAIPRLQALVVGARLRAVLHGSADTLRGDPEFDQALFNQSMIEGLIASGRTPSDWGLWARAVLNVERVVHGGTAGVADEDYYRPIFAYMKKTSAPVDVVDAVTFMHALARWDYPTMAVTGDRVIAHAVEFKRALMAPEVLRDATVIAKLATGDVAGARRVFDVMAKSVKRDPEDVRSALLGAYLIAAEKAVKDRKRAPPDTGGSSVPD